MTILLILKVPSSSLTGCRWTPPTIGHIWSGLQDRVSIVTALLNYTPPQRGVEWQAQLSAPHTDGLTQRWWLCSAPVLPYPRSEPLSSCRPPECCVWRTPPRWCSCSRGWTRSVWIGRAGCSSLRLSRRLTRLWGEREGDRQGWDVCVPLYVWWDGPYVLLDPRNDDMAQSSGPKCFNRTQGLHVCVCQMIYGNWKTHTSKAGVQQITKYKAWIII